MPKWKFRKLEVKGKVKGIGTTTHVNTYGERFTISMLEAMVAQTNGNLTHSEHQYDRLPIGRIISSEIVKLEDGEFGCQITTELYVDPDSIKGMGFSVAGSPAKKV
ncbi:MAG: hypothetical protein WBW16_13760 [Bacteroidota bacterium]